MKKRIPCMILSLIMFFYLVPPANAMNNEAIQAADALYELGLFKGTGNSPDGTPNFDLDRTPTRAEAVTMLVRLLGKDEAAKAGIWDTPFTDVLDWAEPYVGYAYANGLTNGTGATTFGSSDSVTAAQYITFVLRALGYESGKDFQWDRAWELSDELGLTNGTYSAIKKFTRGDAAMISHAALSGYIKGAPQTLKEYLLADGAIRAWHEVDSSGNLALRTSLCSNAQSGYSILIKLYHGNGNFDYDSQSSFDSQIQYKYTSALSYMDNGSSVVREDIYVFRGTDTAQEFFSVWHTSSNENSAFDAVANLLIAKFSLNDTISIQQTKRQFDMTDVCITYDEAAQQETYIACISAPITTDGSYGLVYCGKRGQQNASLSYIGRQGDYLTYTRQLGHFASRGSAGEFFISHCMYSQISQHKFVCKVGLSTGIPYQF